MATLPRPTSVPLDRLRPAAWNPRTIRDDRFAQLCRSLEADPDFLNSRPILAQLDGTIYAGNHRYLAAQHLGWKTIPAILADVPDDIAQRRALIDNNNAADWIDEDLSALLIELQQEGLPVETLGFEQAELTRLLAITSSAASTVVAPAGFPEYNESIETEFQCPRCSFEWSGQAKPNAS